MHKRVHDIICRCEEITEREIRGAIRQFDLKTADEVKRLTRAGMGLCQGRTCALLVERIISEEINKKLSEIFPSNSRPPVRPIKIEFLAKKEEKEI